MLLSELREFLDDEFSYPVDHETVIDEIGEVDVEDTNSEESASVASILKPLSVESYESADELHRMIYGSVGDERVGRKFYDDRGGTHNDEDSERTDETNQSF